MANTNIFAKLFEKSRLVEMANLDPKHTKLRSTLYARFNGKVFETDHNEPHVHVETSSNRKGVPVLIAPKSRNLLKLLQIKRIKAADSKLVDEAMTYIEKHYKLFLQHWNGELTDYELQKELFDNKK